jgi:peptidoglycan/LPS O-acetylase OafA/YrhL
MMLTSDSAFGLVGTIPSLLQRKTSSGWFLPEIDGLRFVAIATVFVIHVIAYTFGANPSLQSSSWLSSNYENLARGVPLFFVISGFVIAMPFVKRVKKGEGQVSLKYFYLRRLTRLEPPFVIAMLLTYASLVLVHHSLALALLPHLLATCTYTHTLIYGSKSPIAFITWSLEIEVQFYLIAPLIMTILNLRPWTKRFTLGALAGASIGVQTMIASSHPVAASSLIGYLPFFIAGIIVCDLAISDDFWQNQRSHRWDATGILAIIGAYSIPNPAFWGNAAMSILFGISVLAVFRGRVLANIVSLRWLTAIGGMCYTIYLLHVPLIYLCGHATRHALIGHNLGTNVGIQLLLLPLPVLIACFLFFLAVEKPCMNKHWPQNLVRFLLPIGHKDVQVETANV